MDRSCRHLVQGVGCWWTAQMVILATPDSCPATPLKAERLLFWVETVEQRHSPVLLMPSALQLPAAGEPERAVRWAVEMAVRRAGGWLTVVWLKRSRPLLCQQFAQALARKHRRCGPPPYPSRRRSPPGVHSQRRLARFGRARACANCESRQPVRRVQVRRESQKPASRQRFL